MTIKVDGNWDKGLAFDVHTLSSTYLGPDEYGHDQWDTTRSEMGELIYKLKYQQDKSTLPHIVALLERIKGIEKFDCIIPIPPTDSSRKFQPVTEITLALGGRHNATVLTDILAKNPGGDQLKNVQDVDKRAELLRNSLYVKNSDAVKGCSILLVDNLYRSGATLSAATYLLYEAGASRVCVLTMTKTRSTR